MVKKRKVTGNNKGDLMLDLLPEPTPVNQVDLLQISFVNHAFLGLKFC